MSTSSTRSTVAVMIFLLGTLTICHGGGYDDYGSAERYGSSSHAVNNGRYGGGQQFGGGYYNYNGGGYGRGQNQGGYYNYNDGGYGSGQNQGGYGNNDGRANNYGRGYIGNGYQNNGQASNNYGEKSGQAQGYDGQAKGLATYGREQGNYGVVVGQYDRGQYKNCYYCMGNGRDNYSYRRRYGYGNGKNCGGRQA